ncbi:uncharacterized protein A4U43_C06F830 [Asparagus officinalis]|uniref:non-specific serine/threonine protein kinase n=1 Tax=Asparagus officinalis TaxID=4686 RepID=A0A5P1EJ49_ASPOF|nr:uncharacterized protein A4U43_C06F830 [Asparagus officinalis]
MDSSGVSGELPSTLSKLANMQIMWASDNNFSGLIPDFIGSWTNLTSLRFQGNSFQGPIPSSLSSLTKLTDLRIGDIINGSSSLAFISNLTSLNTLILRNSKISDSMPSNFASFTSLQKLDLSFNNITGILPQSLFNLNSLSFLFLGNNSLSGSLPASKSRSLSNIDLSYNQLSGSFPPWVSEQKQQLNLVANNFVIDNSNSSGLSSGLNCLQSNIPCNRGSPIYSSFAINCGGSRAITGSDGTDYDIDNANLTTASYYVKESDRWAVSNAGSFAEAPGADYIINDLSQFQNTLDPELFQTARMSPSSLRYYGLGLQNGNYSVTLQFAETAFPDSSTWKSVGRRVFNIYIQGKLEEKDFDIRKAAGGVSFRAIEKQYIAPVTNNFLEIHFFWAGKGTCCVPTQGYYGPSISALTVAPYDFTPTVSNKPPNTSSKSNNTGLVVGIVVAIGFLGFLAVIGVFTWRQRKRRLSQEDAEELSGLSIRPDTFSYSELKTATNDFNPANLLGEGGFGPVYKGKLSDGRLVAVKQLSVQSHQGKRQFVAEIGTISAVQHRNLVKLYGCCIEGAKRLVVYEYLENKSLDQAIFEYAMRGHLTEKADVFGFGVVVLEVLSGRPNADTTLDEEKIYLLEWAWRLHENRHDLELVDSKLSSYNEKEATQLMGVALLCTQASPMLRPHMSRVVAMLTGDIEVPEVTTRPGYLTEWHLKDLSSNFVSSDFSKASTSNYSHDSGTSDSSMAVYRRGTLSPSQPLVSTSISSEGR